MPRQNILHLSKTCRAYRPDNAANCPQGDNGFESLEKAQTEDEHRIKHLRRVNDVTANRIGQRRPVKLAKALERALDRDKFARTPASARSMRRMRIRVIGWLTRLYGRERASGSELAFATIIPNSHLWSVPGDDLESVDAHRLMNQFRVDITRHRGVPKDGWGFFALHGEYDKNHDRWDLHLHGLLAGEMIERVESLREQYPRKYRAAAAPLNCENRRRPPIRVSTDTPRNLSLRIAYIMKSYWPGVVRQHPVTEEALTQPWPSRIPEPRHSQQLLWLDRYRLNELVLLVGLCVQENELKRTQDLCANGDRQ